MSTAVPSAAERDRMLDKIRKLLSLAEGTKYEAEAETAYAKAQELMTRYAIDEAVVRQQEHGARREDVISRVIPMPRQNWRSRRVDLINVIARLNRCRAIDSDWELPRDAQEEMRDLRDLNQRGAITYDEYLKRSKAINRRKGVTYVVGLESDARFVELLVTSLFVQSWRFMHDAGRAQGQALRGVGAAAFGNSFLHGFNSRISQRLREEQERVKREAQERYDREASTGGASIVPVSVELALRETRALVDAEFDKMFPNTRKRRGHGFGANQAAYAAGVAAGDRADLTGGRGTSLGGGRKELGR